MVRLADRYAVPFTVLSLVIAGVAWVASGEAVRFAEVLVVATPCPLLIAAPVAFLGGMEPGCALRAYREGRRHSRTALAGTLAILGALRAVGPRAERKLKASRANADGAQRTPLTGRESQRTH